MTPSSTDYLYSLLVQTNSSSPNSPQTQNHSANNEQEIHDQVHNVPIEIGLDLQSLLDYSFINHEFNNEIYFNNNQHASQFINIENSISSCITSPIHGANDNNINNNNGNIANLSGQYELNDHSLELILSDAVKCDLKEQLNSIADLSIENHQIEFTEPEVSFTLLDAPLAELTHSDLSQFIVLPNNHHYEQRNDLVYSETLLNNSLSSINTSYLKQETVNEFDDEITSYSSPFSNASANTENNSLVLIDQSFRIQSPSSLDSQHSFSVSSSSDLLSKPNLSSDFSTCSLLNASFYSQKESKSEKKKSETKLTKVNKKESNKAAAIRYRTKKLKEKEQLFAECQLYANKNNELRKNIDDLQTRISCIKSLLVEALIKKNSN